MLWLISRVLSCISAPWTFSHHTKKWKERNHLLQFRYVLGHLTPYTDVAEVYSQESLHLSVFVPSFLFLPISHSERAILPFIVSKSHTSQSIHVCSSHFLHSLLVFLFLGFWWHFQSARSLPWDIVHVPTPLRPQKYTRTHTHIESRYTHSLPGARPLCACLPQRSWSLA